MSIQPLIQAQGARVEDWKFQASSLPSLKLQLLAYDWLTLLDGRNKKEDNG